MIYLEKRETICIGNLHIETQSLIFIASWLKSSLDDGIWIVEPISFEGYQYLHVSAGFLQDLCRVHFNCHLFQSLHDSSDFHGHSDFTVSCHLTFDLAIDALFSSWHAQLPILHKLFYTSIRSAVMYVLCARVLTFSFDTCCSLDIWHGSTVKIHCYCFHLLPTPCW